MTVRTALVRRPGPRLAEGLVTHIARTPVDLALAERQWAGYVSALRANGWRTIEVPAVDRCPDSVFVEDTMVVFKDLAVIARPGVASRRPETADAATTVAKQGHRIRHIEEPGTLEGGDVLKIGERVYVGQGGRTNDSGLEQLRAHLTPLGAEVVGVEVTKVLHLKSAVTALPDGTVVGYRELVDDPTVFTEFLPVPDESGAHVVLLDDETVLMAASAPRTAKMFAARGLKPVTVDISEYERLEGCVTCLSVRLRG
jgi:dimethylargininase